MGGLDHTALKVDRVGDGAFEITAIYNDEKWKVIWPTENATKTLQLPVTVPSKNSSSP